MDLRVPARVRYEIEAPGTLVSRRRVDDALHLVYDDSTVVTLQLDSDGLVTVGVSPDRIIALDADTDGPPKIVVTERPVSPRRRRETADATAI